MSAKFSVAGVGLVFLIGCGSSTPNATPVPLSYEHLRHLSAAYIQATTRLNRPPKDSSELEPFLREFGDPAKLLISPNDGQEYVVLWNVDFRQLRPQGNTFPILAYEKTGKEGKRFVSMFREIEQLTEEQFASALFPPGHSPPNMK